MTALRFRLKAGHFLKLQLLPITDDIHIVIMTGLMFDISLDDYINELWMVSSHAISVDPEPRNGSSTMALVMVLFLMG